MSSISLASRCFFVEAGYCPDHGYTELVGGVMNKMELK